MPVVIIPVNYDAASCLFTGQVALSSNRDPFLQANVANTFIHWYEITNCIGSIIDNDQFFVGVVLPEEVRNGLFDKCTAVICRHNATDQGNSFLFATYHMVW